MRVLAADPGAKSGGAALVCVSADLRPAVVAWWAWTPYHGEIRVRSSERPALVLPFHDEVASLVAADLDELHPGPLDAVVIEACFVGRKRNQDILGTAENAGALIHAVRRHREPLHRPLASEWRPYMGPQPQRKPSATELEAAARRWAEAHADWSLAPPPTTIAEGTPVAEAIVMAATVAQSA